MVSITVSLIATTVLCLAFTTTRMLGVGVFALLVFLHPWSLLAAVILSAVGALVFYVVRRRSYHAFPDLDS